MNREVLLKQIAAIDWAEFETAQGNGESVPKYLLQLVSEDTDRSIKATAIDSLW